MRFLTIFCFTILILAAALAMAMPPSGEGKIDPSFKQFRINLLLALKRHDRRFLKGILDPEVKYALGGGVGVSDFWANWQVDAKDSPLWTELSNALQDGAYFDPSDGKDTLHAPKNRNSNPYAVFHKVHGGWRLIWFGSISL